MVDIDLKLMALIVLNNFFYFVFGASSAIKYIYDLPFRKNFN